MKRRFSILRFALFGMLLTTLAPSVNSVSPPADGGYPNRNTAEGKDALFSLDVSAGSDQTAIGYHAMHDLPTAPWGPNTAVGALSLSLQTGSPDDGSVAVGFRTLSHEGIGYQDVAIGTNAMLSHDYGSQNSAIGVNALKAVTHGADVEAVGSGAMQNGHPSDSAAIGYHAYANGTSGGNIVVGSRAFSTGDGSDNVTLGCRAMSHLSSSGHPANIAIGFAAGSQQGNPGGGRNIDIGSPGELGDSKIIRIGTVGKQNSAFVSGITGVTVPDGIGVVVDSNGHLGTTTSSARYKWHVKPMGEASEVIYSLQPVSFQYRTEIDPLHLLQFGLIAEDVAKVAPALVARDQQGRPYAVRYQAINAMLLNEFQKDYRRANQEEATLAAHASELDHLADKVANVEQELEQQGTALTKLEARMN
jgi:hypothetical protein